MKTGVIRTVLACCVALGVCVGTGCKRDPATREARHLARANKLLDAKEYSRAALEFRNAASVNPKRADTWSRMGVAHLGAGAVREAIVAFRRALEIDPSHKAAQLQLSALMVQSRDPVVLQDAVKRLDQVLATASDDPEALDLLALAEMKLKHPEDAEKHLTQVLKRFPGRLKSSAALAALQLSRKDLDGAEKTLRDAVLQAPKSVEAALAMAQLYVLLRRTGEAEAEVRRALELDPASSPSWLALAAIQVGQGKLDDAERTYQKLASLPKANLSFVHAAFLLRRGKHDQAIREFESLASASPDDRNARLRLVNAYLSAGKRAEALAALGVLLKKNAKDSDALLLRSRVHLAERRLKEAEADVQAVLHFKPDSADAHYGLARIYAAAGRQRMREKELAEVLRLSPPALAARVDLALAQVASGQAAAALQTIDAAPGTQKSDLQAVHARNWVLIALNRREEAMAAVEEALKAKQSPQLMIQRAVIKQLNRDYAGARQDAGDALRQDPRHTAALNIFIQSCVAQNQSAAALEKLRAVVAMQPPAAPVLVVAGEWLARLKKPDEARGAFAAAKAAAPAYSAADLGIAALDAAEGKPDRAKATLSALVDNDPQNYSAVMMLASLEYAAKDYGPALAHFRAVADAMPDNAVALNNTAYLLAASDPEQALPYAERALELSPHDPSVQDTAGWVYYRKGLYTKAVRLLETAVTRAPTNVREFHLAMSYIKAGDNARGTRLLKSVLAKDPNLIKTEQGW